MEYFRKLSDGLYGVDSRDKSARQLHHPTQKVHLAVAPVRFRFQFGIRTALLLTTMAAIAIVATKFAVGPSLDERLEDAVENGDLSRVRLWLRLGADANAGKGDSGYGFSPVQQAALDGNIEIVRLLLDFGAEPNYREKDGFTSIVYAADDGQWDLVRLLHEAGADHRLEGADGKSVLDHAIAQGRGDIVELLCSRPTPREYWQIKTRDEPLGNPAKEHRYRRRYSVTYKLKDDWPVKRYEAVVERQASGEERTIGGVASVAIADDGNAIIVTEADGTVRREAI